MHDHDKIPKLTEEERKAKLAQIVQKGYEENARRAEEEAATKMKAAQASPWKKPPPPVTPLRLVSEASSLKLLADLKPKQGFSEVPLALPEANFTPLEKT